MKKMNALVAVSTVLLLGMPVSTVSGGAGDRPHYGSLNQAQQEKKKAFQELPGTDSLGEDKKKALQAQKKAKRGARQEQQQNRKAFRELPGTDSLD